MLSPFHSLSLLLSLSLPATGIKRSLRSKSLSKLVRAKFKLLNGQREVENVQRGEWGKG